MLLLLSLAAYAADPLQVHATTHTLPNGLVVVLEEDHRTDEVALHIRYGVGSRDEKPDELGCAHLFEHLMFEGSKDVPGNAFDRWLTAAGGDNNAWTSEDGTAYHMTFPSGAIDLGLFLESDRMGFLIDGLTPENVKNQQDVVLQERAEDYSVPNGPDVDAIETLLFPEGHPYHHPVLGQVGTIRAFTTEGVQGFWKSHYRPRNAVLVLVGNFDSDKALEAVTKWWGDVPDPGPAAERAAPQTFDAKPHTGKLEEDVDARTLYVAWPTVPESSPDAPALDLLATLLSDGRGTRFDDKVYYDSKLAVDDGAWSWTGQAGGYFLMYATAPKVPLTKIQGATRGVIDSLSTKPPTAAELDRARKSFRGHVLDQLELPEDRAEMIASCWVRYGKPDCLEEQWADYEKVTPDDLVRVAKTYLTPSRETTLSVVPKNDKGALPGAETVVLP